MGRLKSRQKHERWFMELEIVLMGGKKVDAHYQGFTIATDVPKDQGGGGTGPSPSALLLASVGTCAGFNIQFFCQKHNIPPDQVKLRITSENDSRNGLMGKIILDIHVSQDFPGKYLNSVKKVAESCVVKKNINNQPVFDIRVDQAT